MKRIILFALLFGCTFAADAFGVLLSEIQYEVQQTSPSRWQYTYNVKNINLPAGIEELTIWFDYGLYDNLLIETQEPLASAWDELAIQPEPLLGDDGFYDALSLSAPIFTGESIKGFSVSFDWLGQGLPASQFYEIINPATFQTIDSGFTTPEPSTLLLLGLGFLFLHNQRKRG